ncbi:MAG: hypothetical protein C7B44_05720 [Sulfobacillus thermosulfidooxidans]|nr:MAG: hypothetical protein C7B44_05720 [Sulfobacillus thermosulfidooxidans]
MDFETYLTRVAELDVPRDAYAMDSDAPLTVTATDSLYALFERFMQHWIAGASTLVWPSYLWAPQAATTSIRSTHTVHGDEVVYYVWRWELFTRDPDDPPHAADAFDTWRLDAAQTVVWFHIQHILTLPSPYFVVQARIHSSHFTVPDRILLELPVVTQITFTPSHADSAVGFDALWQFDETAWSLREALVQAAEHARAIPSPNWLRHAQAQRRPDLIRWIMARPERVSAAWLLVVAWLILVVLTLV